MHGGVPIYVNDVYPASVLQSVYFTKEFEFLALEVYLGNNKLVVTEAYHP